MATKSKSEQELEQKISELEREIADLKLKTLGAVEGHTVRVPDQIRPLFDQAEEIVGKYFQNLKLEPTHGTLEINGQRYVLVRAAALSYDFLNTFKSLYADRGPREAFLIGKNFLFDIAHLIGLQDAKNFHSKMNLQDPISKLSAGPVHFAYTGWALVDIFPESNPSPDDNYFLKYQHIHSFEADSWISGGHYSDRPVCIMNSGYSSGWCEESFGIPLTTVELTCRAQGAPACTFIMAPPHRIQEYVKINQDELTTDITGQAVYEIPTFFERKKVEEESHAARLKAEESDRAKSEFLANMSHEIRTPLNAIIGYIDLLNAERMPKEQREYFETIRESSLLLQAIIDDILDLSKIDAGQLMMEKVPFSVSQVLQNMQTTGQALLSQRRRGGVRLQCDNHLERTRDIVLGDPTRLRQILYNLLSNAIKFTEEGSIEYGVQLEGDRLVFHVRDTGIGIPRDKFEKIFEIFGQADASVSREYGGSGLGLTITKKLVRMMGGEISLESKVGQGSCFSFSIPYQSGKPIETIREKTSETSDKAHKTILVVDDNSVNLHLTRRILEKSGYHILEAKNGSEAIELFHSQPMDLILMDVQMPVLDGLTTTRKIREFEDHEKKKMMPIIALTAHAMEADKRKCMEAGYNYYLTKPIVIDRLLDAIRKYI